jgi:U3 small nucleolar RNA-associated protein 12
VQPGSTTILSGGADKTIAFWTPREPKPNVVKLEEERRHELNDDVLCARFTPEGKHVVAALLDASIRILFTDSLKLFLTLYGHQLPVLCVSASSDGELLASGAADKTIKIWGLDFGDCHRSLHGHTESVMCVAFVRETHFFFSSSKDKTVRYWDADHFEQILCLKGHHADVWAMAPSRSGSFVVSASKDRSLRLWKRSDEQVFLEEEREAALEELFEAGLEKRQEYAEAEEEEAAALGMEPQAEAAAAGRRTMETVKGAERVLEALKTLTEESERVAEYENAHAKWTARGAAGEGSKQPVLVPNMLLLGLDQGAYLLKALSSVRATELEQALLLLPFDAAKALLTRLLPLVPRAPPVELMAKVILFLLRVHHKQIVGSAGLLTMLNALDTSLRSRLAQEHGVIGYNLAAMRYMRQQLEQVDDTRFFAGALEQSTATGRDSIGELRRKTAARERGSKREKKLKGRKMKEVAEAAKKKAM